jgi:hypothetical protein
MVFGMTAGLGSLTLLMIKLLMGGYQYGLRLQLRL